MPRLKHVPKLVIDHLGLSTQGLPSLLSLVERGAWVKATGFSRGDLDIARTLKAISAINPDALLFGTDLPSTRAPRPFNRCDIRLIQEALEESLMRKVFYENAIQLYRPKTH
jgi:predicted TIM-barrel fold metal-dependent hydrolase